MSSDKLQEIRDLAKKARRGKPLILENGLEVKICYPRWKTMNEFGEDSDPLAIIREVVYTKDGQQLYPDDCPDSEIQELGSDTIREIINFAFDLLSDEETHEVVAGNLNSEENVEASTSLPSSTESPR